MITDLVRELGAEVGLDLPAVHVTGDDPVLPSAFRVGTAAAATVGAVTAAVALVLRSERDRLAASKRSPDGFLGGGPPAPDAGRVPAERVTVDVREAAIAFRDERYFRIDGEAGGLWAPLSGDYRTADGWVRLHCNFDHHRDAALRALGLPLEADKEQVAEACARRMALSVEEAVTEAGGCAAAMRSRAEWDAHPQSAAVAETPLVAIRRLDHEGSGVPAPDPRGGATAAAGRPLEGIRVLDLTRVIAGPVASRTLAAHGADVLRVGAAHLPEVPGLVVSTAFGKRSCEIDLRTREGVAALRELVAGADVLIQAYRPGALAALGFGPEDLAAIRPGIVSVDISAYGTRGPWAGRRGFDSLVQMACGIAHEGGDGDRPVPLPAQVLDHSAGWLAALGALAGLLRRRAEGGSWHVELSLARVARWLDGLGRVDGGQVAEPDPSDLLDEMDAPQGRLTYVRAPGAIGDLRPYWTSPPPRRAEHPPAWW
ncbi:carnitine dehydratase [Sphaerisporangium album]|uniref:Carnitine dehydratase n=1 Tax=Sphaerisporangium album TaxID=509200 RepID=A0A367FN49_9ACTN|nr:carnitine dehydratase [Sphaerisporangium album]